MKQPENNIRFPPKEIYTPSGIEKKDFEFIILWMLNNNEKCNWSNFLDEPLNFSLATLSKYMNQLIADGYVDKVSKGVYKITPEGQKRYINKGFKDSYERKLRYPPQVILNTRNYNHIILWMLNNNEFCKWTDFLEKPLSINNHSLSKSLNLLIEKGAVINEKMEYRITKKGVIKYTKMLKKYHLDYQTLIEEEIEKLEDIKMEVSEFLKKYDIYDKGIEVIFIDLINHLEFEKIETVLPSKEDFFKILLFFSMNHPQRYPKYISSSDFSANYNIDPAILNFFIKSLVEENYFKLQIFNLRINEERIYYFRENEKFEKLLRLIIEENIEKFSYLKKLQPDLLEEQKMVQTYELLDNIEDEVCDKLFNRELKSILKRIKNL